MEVSYRADTPNYLSLMDEAMTFINMEYNDSTILDAMTEMYILGDAYEAKELVLRSVTEAPGGVTMGVNKAVTQRNVSGIIGNVKEFIRKVIKFMSEALENFKEAATRLVQEDSKWVSDNAPLFNSMNKELIATLKVTCVPWGERKCFERLRNNKIPMTNGGNLRQILEWIGKHPEAITDKLACYKEFFPDLYKLDDKDPKHGALLWYRDGENETTLYQGDKAFQMIKKMVDYCTTYKAYSDSAIATVNDAKQQSEKEAQEIERLEKENERIAKEGYEFGSDLYSILEEASLLNTEFAQIPIVDEYGLSVIREDDISGGGTAAVKTTADSGDKGGSGNQQPQSNNDPKTVKDANKDKDQQQKSEADKQKEADKARRTADNNIQKNDHKQQLAMFELMQTVAIAKLTVCEEIQKSYINILHGVADGVRKYNGNQEEDTNNRNYNKERKDANDARNKEKIANAKATSKAKDQKKGALRWLGSKLIW